MLRDELLQGKYKIVRTLGQGGMGRVYLAENINLGTLWAIKELKKKSASGLSLFVEPNILKKLNHPSLPRIFDIFEDNESIFIVVDYIEGISLDKKLDEDGSIPEEEVIEWALQLCDVLKYLHNIKPNPIIYRDMKPSNIILTDGGKLKLIDFGIAREYKRDEGNDTVCIGTRGYAAPEQYGAGQTCEATDIYSLGVTLYHLLTGKGPNEYPYEIKPVRYFNKDLSCEIEEIIIKCTKQNPSERYKSVQELSEDLRQIIVDRALKVPGHEHEACSIKTHESGKAFRQASFKKVVLTVWDNAEFGCELAYIAAKLTDFKVMLIDLNLLSPKADLYLNIKKYPEGIISEGILSDSGLNIVMDSIEKNFFTPELLIKASIKRRELKNLYILTGNYNLENYEYYRNESLVKLIEKSYQQFDIVILLVDRSIYDSYTVISLKKSDYNIIPLRADVDMLREYNNYLVFLRDKQKIPLEKTKFVAYEYNSSWNLNSAVLKEVTEGNYIGCVSFSCRRLRYRNLKLPYAKRMEELICREYVKILNAFNIVPKPDLKERFYYLLYNIQTMWRTVKTRVDKGIGKRRGRRKHKNAHS